MIDLPMISWEHARIFSENGEFFIEDLHSSNGTSLNQIGNKISRRRIQINDDVYLGSLKVPASRLLKGTGTAIGAPTAQPVDLQEETIILGRDPQCDESLDDPLVSWHHAKISRSGSAVFLEDLSSRNGTFLTVFGSPAELNFVRARRSASAASSLDSWPTESWNAASTMATSRSLLLVSVLQSEGDAFSILSLSQSIRRRWWH